MRKSFWYRAGPWLFVGGAALLGGCPSNPATDGGGGGGDKPDLVMTMTMPDAGPDMAVIPTEGPPSLAASTTGGDYTRPFDSVPDSDAQTFYFTAMNAKGMGVFKVARAGGDATEVAVGSPFHSPFGIAISADSKTLFVADHGAGGDPMGAPNTPDAPGGIYKLSTGGGSPSVMNGTAGYVPCGVDVRGNDLYFTGVDPADGKPGLFKIPTAGGAVTAVAKGDPFASPCGVTLARNGEAYVADTGGGSAGVGRVIKVSGASASVFVEPVLMGFPAGIALTISEKLLLVSGQSTASGMSVVFVIDTATKAISEFNKGLEGSSDSGGLHRALSDGTMSWCGVTVGDRGTVFRVEFK